MKYIIKPFQAALTIVLICTAPLASANGQVNWSVTLGSPAPVYAPPPVVYVEPQPVYVRPAPVYVRPAPVYVQPATIVQYGQPYYVEEYGYPHGRHGHWHHRH